MRLTRPALVFKAPASTEESNNGESTKPQNVRLDKMGFLPADDDTAELPVVKEGLKTPEEWAKVYSTFVRLLAAVHSAARAVDDLHDEEPADVHRAFEEAAEIVTTQEPHAMPSSP